MGWEASGHGRVRSGLLPQDGKDGLRTGGPGQGHMPSELRAVPGLCPPNLRQEDVLDDTS